MTTTPTRTRAQVHHRSRRRRPRAGDVLRGLAATVAILAVVVGVPLLLAVIAPLSLPTALPTWEQVSAGLMRPDDGTAFLTVLTLIAWAGWAVFTLSVVVEVFAQARGLPTPRIPLARTSQRLAAGLVTTAGLLLASTAPLTTAAAHATTAPATRAATASVATTPAAHAVVHEPLGPAPGADAAAAVAPAKAAGEVDPGRAGDRYPVVVVERGDSLWRLAERHLGDGERYGEIVDLNHGRPQADGHTLTDTHWLNPGWELRLPADATGVTTQPATSATPSSEAHAKVEVEPGDTLWDIAADELGDGTRYAEIYDLNAGVPQDDGRTLTDPDLIRPGWDLTLPTPPPPTVDTTATDPPSEVTPPAGVETVDETAGPGIPTPPALDGAFVGDPAPGAGADAAATPADVAAPPAAAPAPSPGPAPAAQDVSEAGLEDAEQAPAQQSLFAGLTALGAATVIGFLSRRRRRQQNHRRPGERITLPAAGTPAAVTERELRRADLPLTVEDLNRALHRLAPAAQEAGRDLPAIAAVRVTPEAVELLLSGDDTGVLAPFTATGPRTWTTTREAVTGQDDGNRWEYAWPYPVLVSLGVDDDGAVVMVNLEAAGTLVITGEAATADAVLRALACELMTSRTAEACDIRVGPALDDIAAATYFTATVQSTDPGRVGRAAHQHVKYIRDFLAQDGTRDVLQARAHWDADEAWYPDVHLDTHPAPALPAWSGAAIVTSRGPVPDGAWHLAVQPDGAAHLHPLGLDLRASRLSEDGYAHIVELLAAATTTDTGADPAPGDRAAPSLAEDTVETLAALPHPTTPLDPAISEVDAPEQSPADTPTVPATGPVDVTGDRPPRVLLLGPVQITGTSGDTRSRRTSELLAYLALHPGATAAELDEVIGRGDRVSAATRNTAMSRARAWLGKDPDGQPYLLPYQAGSGYRLSPQVRTDRDDFLHLARRGLAAGPAGAADLGAALALVRGRPFAGTAPGTYDWAEATTQEMISTITDVAHVLARTYLDAGDPVAAAAAAAVGLTVDPCNETLYRDAITAAGRRGDTEEIHRLANNLQAHLDQIDDDEDVEPETYDLIHRLVGYGNNAVGYRRTEPATTTASGGG